MPAVKAETGHRSHASIYNAIKAGLFTKPVQIGQRSVGWPANEVNAINTARIAGKSDSQIRELITRLHVKRVELAEFYDSPVMTTTNRVLGLTHTNIDVKNDVLLSGYSKDQAA